MKSTGEVMGIADDFPTAFLKSQLGSGIFFRRRHALRSVKDSDKTLVAPAVRAMVEFGFKVIATAGTADYLRSQGIEVSQVNKVAQGRPHIVDKIKDGEVALIFNTTEGWQSHKDSASIRASALMAKVPYFTTRPRAPPSSGRSGPSAAAVLKFGRFRTIIPPPERDPEQLSAT
jgi:carbamoyl-phosphate synthase large subunit